MRFIGKQSDKIGDATKITLGSTGSSQTTDLGSKDIASLFSAGNGTSITVSNFESGELFQTIVAFNGINASTSAKGVAQFSSDNFAASSGTITIKDGGVDLTAEVTGVLPSANMDSDTAHLSTDQTFTGTKTFDETISGSIDGNAATATNLTASTSTAVGLGTIELGHATDTTIARSAAGKVTIESAPIQTTQMSVTNHAFALDSNNSAYNYFPLNNLNETRAGDTSQYYARLIAPYAGKVLRVVVRATADMGDCRIRLTKLSTSGQDPDGLRDEGTDVETTDAVDCSAINTTHTFNLTGAFAAGDVVNVGILKGSTNTAFVTAAVVWEYTV